MSMHLSGRTRTNQRTRHLHQSPSMKPALIAKRQTFHFIVRKREDVLQSSRDIPASINKRKHRTKSPSARPANRCAQRTCAGHRAINLRRSPSANPAPITEQHTCALLVRSRKHLYQSARDKPVPMTKRQASAFVVRK